MQWRGARPAAARGGIVLRFVGGRGAGLPSAAASLPGRVLRSADVAAPTVTVGPRALRVGERDVPLWAGAMHHFLVEPRRWRPCLAALRECGYTLVETAAPWGLHERSPGSFDFAHGARDLGGFLDAVAEEGLLAAVRVGPQIGGEQLWGGLPARIAADAAMQQRTADGSPSFTLVPPRGYAPPSYGSRRFLDEVGAWYRALGEVLAPRLHPRGPVVLLVVDHELGGFLRAGPYTADYHPDVLEAWHAEQGEVPPPRRFEARTPEELAPHLAWMAFRERRIAVALGELGARLDEAGLVGVPRLHGFAALDPQPASAAAVERSIEIVGAHFLQGRRGLAATRRLALELAGGSRLAVAAPLSLGCPAWAMPTSDEAIVDRLLAALMHGVVGDTGAMAVGRDRWVGAPTEPDGTLRPTLAGPLARIHGALAAADFVHLRRPVAVGLVVPRAYRQLGLASSRLGPLAAIAAMVELSSLGLREERFGLDGPVATEQEEAGLALVDALDAAGVPFVILDEHVGAARLAELAAVLVMSFDFFDEGLAVRLRDFAAAGGRVAWGPRAPSRNAAMQHAGIALPGAPFDAATLADPARLAEVVAALGTTVEPRATVTGAALASLHLGADGAPALLFVAETGGEAARVPVTAPGGPWIDVRTDERFDGATFDVPMPALGVRLLARERP